jgi:putrescine transport system ATP-binding protein
MRLELVRLQHEVGITFVIVTHDQEEALSMADRIGVMDQGRLLQVASPQALYEAPSCRMVADFIGQMNLFCGRVTAVGADGLVVASELGELRFERAGLGMAGSEAAEVGIAVRPEKVTLSRERPQDKPIAVCGRVVQLAYLGDASLVYVETETARRITCRRPNQRGAGPPVAVGETCWVAWDPADCLLLTA